MMILSRVCAQFHNAKGETVFTVTPALRNLFTEAPEEIREDPLFRLLIRDGSLEARNGRKCWKTTPRRERTLPVKRRRRRRRMPRPAKAGERPHRPPRYPLRRFLPRRTVRQNDGSFLPLLVSAV